MCNLKYQQQNIKTVVVHNDSGYIFSLIFKEILRKGKTNVTALTSANRKAKILSVVCWKIKDSYNFLRVMSKNNVAKNLMDVKEGHY